ncbi:hypothetical protein CHARACLAT_003220 [Characodon lateralis]|uniref:Uncharacterized protein n=1 Tax=Characodon lateralis TaxID=208331 RepID=A0ABU7DR24_9TELE|nr:hypothetical protein [Characodon lateralis]
MHTHRNTKHQTGRLFLSTRVDWEPSDFSEAFDDCSIEAFEECSGKLNESIGHGCSSCTCLTLEKSSNSQ